MFAWLERLLLPLLLLLPLGPGAAAGDQRFGLGTPATASQIAGWDIDVRPDGHGH